MTSISIIGRGKMGGAIANIAALAGADIQIVNRSAKPTKDLPGASYAALGDDLTGDLVVLAVPYGAYPNILKHYRNRLGGKVVIESELKNEVNGEVDDRSWEAKQTVLTRPAHQRRESKVLQRYVRQALEDTLTLYLHGICCDIDVAIGPRQMPSRFIRKRLELLYQLFPPPEGYAVFPEHLNRR